MARNLTAANSDVINCGAIGAVSGAFTLAIWFNVTTFPADRAGLIGRSDGSSQYYEIQVRSAAFGKLAYYCNATAAIDPGLSAISAGSWNHVAMTYNTGGTKAYLNGLNDGTTASGSAPSTTNANFLLGSDFLAAGRFFNGKLADAAIWNGVVLTPSEVGALAKGVRPYLIRPASLFGYWPLDGLQSPEPNLSGTAKNGTLTGTAYANGPPMTMFTPKSPWRIVRISAPTILYDHNIGASFTRKVTTIGY